jgi:hypothetical protein
MTEEKNLLAPEDWPKGLYMIFVFGDDTVMGQVIGLTNTNALIHPWDFMFGGVDEEKVMEIVLADVKSFHAFDDIWKMDSYNASHYWNK